MQMAAAENDDVVSLATLYACEKERGKSRAIERGREGGREGVRELEKKDRTHVNSFMNAPVLSFDLIEAFKFHCSLSLSLCLSVFLMNRLSFGWRT